MVSGEEGVFKLEVQKGVSLGQDGSPGGRGGPIQAGKFVHLAAALEAEALTQVRLAAGQDIDAKMPLSLMRPWEKRGGAMETITSKGLRATWETQAAVMPLTWVLQAGGDHIRPRAPERQKRLLAYLRPPIVNRGQACLRLPPGRVTNPRNGAREGPGAPRSTPHSARTCLPPGRGVHITPCTYRPNGGRCGRPSGDAVDLVWPWKWAVPFLRWQSAGGKADRIFMLNCFVLRVKVEMVISGPGDIHLACGVN